MKVSGWIAACALSAAGLVGFSAPPAAADITGSVTLEGEAPEMEELEAMQGKPECAELHAEPVVDDRVIVGEGGELVNVVVSLKRADGGELTGEIPQEPAVLDQVGCMYVPHVVAAMVGQQVLAKSQDDFAHNVHPVPFENEEQNIAFIGVDQEGKELGPYQTPEKFQTECNVHPWMKARICVFPHPYFAVTGEGGTYTIPTAGLEDGEYVVMFWHEVFAHEGDGVEGPTITVENGAAEVDAFSLSAEAAAAQADEVEGDVQLASLETAAPEAGAPASKERCTAGGECCKKAKPAKEAEAVEAVADATGREE